MEMDERFQAVWSLGRERTWRVTDGVNENDDVIGELASSKSAAAAAEAKQREEIMIEASAM